MNHKPKKYSYFLSAAFALLLMPFAYGVNLSDNDLNVLPNNQETLNIEDPLEDLNRSFFEFNRTFDTYILNPLAEMYDEGLPDTVKDSIHSILSNLSTPLIFLNDTLQLEDEKAINSLVRFVTNTFLGLGGMFDPAAEIFDVPHHSSDFGQTLGKYGANPGPYIVIPIIGPSNARDFMGRIVDFIVDPFNYAARRNHVSYLTYTRIIINAIDTRANANALWNRVNLSYDPYKTLQSIYNQNRQFMINENVSFETESPRPSEN